MTRTGRLCGAVDHREPQTDPLPSTFQPNDPLPSSATVLSAATLSNAGLSTLSLKANTSVTVAQGARIALAPGGTFNAAARQIENYGSIIVPGGAINLTLEMNITGNPMLANGVPTNPRYVPLPQVIYLAPGSSLSAAGERIDNSGAAVYSGIATSGYIGGGSILIQDETVNGKGVIVGPGAVVDVSGGYEIAPKGQITGGNAGSLSLQGYSVVLEGDLRAYSLFGTNGGSLTMTSYDVTVAPSGSVLPSGFTLDDALPPGLTLGAHQLDATGFTSITLSSVNNITVEGGLALAPSLVKLSMPSPAGATQGSVVGVSTAATQNSPTFTATPDEAGKSSITMTAEATASIDPGLSNPNGPMNQANAEATITISPGAAVRAGPGGSITLGAPGGIDIGGTLDAPGGTITATGGTSLTLEAGRCDPRSRV